MCGVAPPVGGERSRAANAERVDAQTDPPRRVDDSNARFDAWADTFAAAWVFENPMLATVTQYFEGAEQDAADRRLALCGAGGETIGAGAARARADVARHGLEELRTFEAGELDLKRRVSARFIERRLCDAIATAEFAGNRLVFEQFHGLHVMLITFMTTLHPLRSARDAENYLARLGLVAACLDAGIREAGEAAAAGVLPPRFILERAIAQLDGLIAGRAREHILVTSLERGLSALDDVCAEVRETTIERAARLVEDSVVPALARVRALLEEQLPRSTGDPGASRLPDGRAFYAQQLALFTGSSQTPEEIHAIGLREVARIEGEMHALLDRLGRPPGAIGERIDQMNATLVTHEEGDPREAIVLQLRAIVDDAVERSAAVFSLRPKAPVTVEREPAHTEATAAAHYTVPAADGSKPGIYWVPLADIAPGQPWLGIGTKSTAYHEAVPGHHFQLAIQQEAMDLPRFRKRMAFGFDASFGEGWALYAEHLAAEFDWYGDDLAGRLGYLEMQLFRARRLVADTGLHAFGWTRERAIEYGLPVSEVERYIVWPGQACAYMLGQLRILEFRERARTALGARFSLNAFHDLVLGNGSLPLDVLADVVDEWVAATP
jgi:uncharacterized protein (DUF885 family)